MKRIRELDGLRCFAILAVIATHYRPVFNHWFDVLSIGWTGVDLFFGISGFLITVILLGLRDSRHPFRTFYVRRTLRIFPPYYLVFAALTAMILLNHELLRISDTLQIGLFLMAVHPHLMSQLLHSVATFHHLDYGLRLMDTHVLRSASSGMGVFWSLSVEELFYVAWAPLVVRGSRRLIIIAVSAAILICPVLRIFGDPIMEYTFFFLRLDSLCWGACVALLLAARGDGWLQTQTLQRLFLSILPVSLTAFIALLWKAGAFHGVEPRSSLLFSALGYTAVSATFSCIVGLSVLYAGGRGVMLRLLRLRPLVYVGTVSYMMYLIHIPAYVLIKSLLAEAGAPMQEQGLGLALAGGALTLLISSVSWRYFESPILRWKDRHVHTSAASEQVDREVAQSAV